MMAQGSKQPAPMVLADEIVEVSSEYGTSIQAHPEVYAITIPSDPVGRAEYEGRGFRVITRGAQHADGTPMIRNEHIYQVNEMDELMRGGDLIAAVSMAAHQRYLERLREQSTRRKRESEGERLRVTRVALRDDEQRKIIEEV